MNNVLVLAKGKLKLKRFQAISREKTNRSDPQFLLCRLSGESPFLSESEEDTFRRITEGRWEFSDVFDYVSKEAKDFITRLLMKESR